MLSDRSRPPRLRQLAHATVAALVGATAWPVLAADADASALRLDGFGTLAGVVVEPNDAWGFRREITQAAHHDTHVRFDVDSRVGLQAQWSTDPQLELVGQVVLKPRAERAPIGDNIVWAFAAWHPTPDWTLRVGRTSPDAFLLADVRNVGFAYPWIRPNVEFYGWMPVAYGDGVDVSRQWTAGPTRWRAKLFTGSSSVTVGATQEGASDTKAHVDWFNGGTLTMDSDGFTLKATFAQGRTEPEGAAGRAMAHQVLDVVAGLPIPTIAQQAAALRASNPAGLYIFNYAALGASWERGPWQLQAELARTLGNFDMSKSWHGYASAAWRTGNTTLFAMAGAARSTTAPLPETDWAPTLTPIVGPTLANAAQAVAAGIGTAANLDRVEQHSFSVGMRWDFGPRTALKVQLDDIHSAPYGGGLWAYNTTAAHRALVLSTGLDFVF